MKKQRKYLFLYHTSIHEPREHKKKSQKKKLRGECEARGDEKEGMSVKTVCYRGFEGADIGNT